MTSDGMMMGRLHCASLVFIFGGWIIVTGEGGGGVLYPQDSESREVKRLDGIWHFRPDLKGEEGFHGKWFQKELSSTGDVYLMPVPSSYNDITQDKAIRDHVGWVWYSTDFFVPRSWSNPEETRVFLRFGSANRFASVWVNGHHLLNHSGGYLPFTGEVTSLLHYGRRNLLVVALNNTLTPLTIPQGTLHYPNDTTRYPKGYVSQSYNFDYFNFAGIHRPVHLYTTPPIHIEDITVITDFKDEDGENGEKTRTGRVFYEVEYSTPKDWGNSVTSPMVACHASILDHESKVVHSSSSKECSALLNISSVRLWWPRHSVPKNEEAYGPGYRYTLELRLESNDGGVSDVYRLKFGMRKAEIVGKQFHINGRPFYFQGFGRHEDYSIRGRGVDPVMLVKDHNLLLWTGANSYRTSHYPYAEEILDLTDELGIAVIDESPAIGLTGYWNTLKKEHIKTMKELVKRDKNRPSVVMWSIGNEPKSMEKPAPAYFEDVIQATRAFDPEKRPITIVMSANFSEGICPSLDVISINRYYAWYGDTGRMEVIPLQIPTEVKLWYDSYKKPVLITEYGAGSVAGMHQNPSFLWTEDYQGDYLLHHFKAFDHLRRTVKYFIGEMIWNFADFATPEETFRPWGCMKGIFTRERQPKLAAHLVRARYWRLANETANKYNLTESSIPEDLYIRSYFDGDFYK